MSFDPRAERGIDSSSEVQPGLHPVLPLDTARARTDRPLRLGLPVLLFLATCLTTYAAAGLAYAAPLLITLLCHEFGHFLQARRYGVPASLPYFIPMPGSPLGTMGAVIAMRG